MAKTREQLAQDQRQATAEWRKAVGVRLREVLDGFPNRKMAAQTAGRSDDQLANYISGRSAVPFEVAARLGASAGVSLDWIANGKPTPERQGTDLSQQDLSILRDVITEVMSGLVANGRTMEPRRFADLCMAVFQLAREDVSNGRDADVGRYRDLTDVLLRMRRET